MAQDPYRYFRIEAHELMDQLGKGVLDLEKGSNPQLVALLLRLAHTMKGAARVVRQPAVAEHAHHIEDILTPFRDLHESVPRRGIDDLLGQLDAMAELLRAITLPHADAGNAPPVTVREEWNGAVQADMGELDTLMEGIGDLHARLGALRHKLGTLERVKHLAELLVDRSAALNARRTPSGHRTRHAHLCELSEEMASLTRHLGRDVDAGMSLLDREIVSLREGAQRLRLVPARTLFTSLERTARDAAQVLGKRIAFTGSGGDVRLDPQVLAVVQTALVQMVRNCVAHGIEPEATRILAGKPPTGSVTITIARRGRDVVFTGSDDGRGVDLEAVRRAAQRRSLSAAADMDAAGLLELLLAGGISTAPTVTEVAGRGIGLDVVRTTAKRFAGTARIHSLKGLGTQVEMVVPLSLAAVEVLLVETDGRVAAIPREAVRRTVRVKAGSLMHTADGDSLLHEGTLIPFVPLAALLTAQPPPAAAGRAWTAMIVGSAAGVAAIGVDHLRGIESLMFRPLPALAVADPLVAGAWLDADGNPQVVLDPEILVAKAGIPVAPPPPPKARIAVLVVDDSLTTRMLEQSILESAGYAVGTATSGEEALEKVRSTAYALVLVDVEMPGMDGFTFIERMRATPHLQNLPAILVTSRCAPEDRLRGEQVGANGYVVKSDFNQGQLLARIRSLVG